jgi:hypothetical protein
VACEKFNKSSVLSRLHGFFSGMHTATSESAPGSGVTRSKSLFIY